MNERNAKLLAKVSEEGFQCALKKIAEGGDLEAAVLEARQHDKIGKKQHGASQESVK